MRETWYVLDDGTSADPAECKADPSGKLIHKSGIAVAMRGDAHSSRSVDPERERAKTQPKPKPAAKDMKPDDQKTGYRTRESKAE